MWILLSLLACSFQTVRNATSKHRSRELTALSVALVRFGYGLPIILLFMFLVWLGYGAEAFGRAPGQAIWAMLFSALTQAVGSALFVASLSRNNLFASLVLHRIEIPVALVVGAVFMNDVPTLAQVAAVVLALLGVLLAALPSRSAQSSAHPEYKLGIVYGVFGGVAIGLCSVSSRYGIMAFEGGTFVGNALVFLLGLLIPQSLGLIALIAYKNPGEFAVMRRGIRSDFLIGASSGLGSACWGFAFALAPVALVKTVGQVELLFSWFISGKFFRERPRKMELVGGACIAVAVVLLAV